MSRRIGVTQRVEEIPGYGERRDCLDQQWFVLLERLELDPVPIPNSLADPAAWLVRAELDGVVLSGGNDLVGLPNAARPAPERDRTERVVLEHGAAKALPVLAVCRGLQLINTFLGGWLSPVQGHVASRHLVEPLSDDPIFGSYGEVNSFHAWGLPPDGLGPGLKATLRAEDGGIEAVCHERLPWIGIMWHPEREQPFTNADLNLITKLFGRYS